MPADVAHRTGLHNRAPTIRKPPLLDAVQN